MRRGEQVWAPCQVRNAEQDFGGLGMLWRRELGGFWLFKFSRSIETRPTSKKSHANLSLWQIWTLSAEWGGGFRPLVLETHSHVWRVTKVFLLIIGSNLTEKN